MQSNHYTKYKCRVMSHGKRRDARRKFFFAMEDHISNKLRFSVLNKDMLRFFTTDLNNIFMYILYILLIDKWLLNEKNDH